MTTKLLTVDGFQGMVGTMFSVFIARYDWLLSNDLNTAIVFNFTVLATVYGLVASIVNHG